MHRYESRPLGGKSKVHGGPGRLLQGQLPEGSGAAGPERPRLPPSLVWGRLARHAAAFAGGPGAGGPTVQAEPGPLTQVGHSTGAGSCQAVPTEPRARAVSHGAPTEALKLRPAPAAGRVGAGGQACLRPQGGRLTYGRPLWFCSGPAGGGGGGGGEEVRAQVWRSQGQPAQVDSPTAAPSSGLRAQGAPALTRQLGSPARPAPLGAPRPMAGLNVSLSFFFATFVLCQAARRACKALLPAGAYASFAREAVGAAQLGACCLEMRMLAELGPWAGGFGPDLLLTLLTLLFLVHGATCDGAAANPTVSLQDFLLAEASGPRTLLKLAAQGLGVRAACALTRLYWAWELCDLHVLQNLLDPHCSSPLRTPVSHGALVEGAGAFLLHLTLLRLRNSLPAYRVPAVALLATVMTHTGETGLPLPWATSELLHPRGHPAHPHLRTPGGEAASQGGPPAHGSCRPPFPGSPVVARRPAGQDPVRQGGPGPPSFWLDLPHPSCSWPSQEAGSRDRSGRGEGQPVRFLQGPGRAPLWKPLRVLCRPVQEHQVPPCLPPPPPPPHLAPDVSREGSASPLPSSPAPRAPGLLTKLPGTAPLSRTPRSHPSHQWGKQRAEVSCGMSGLLTSQGSCPGQGNRAVGVGCRSCGRRLTPAQGARATPGRA